MMSSLCCCDKVLMAGYEYAAVNDNDGVNVVDARVLGAALREVHRTDEKNDSHGIVPYNLCMKG